MCAKATQPAANMPSVQQPLQMLFRAWFNLRFSALITASLPCSGAVVEVFAPGIRVPFERTLPPPP
jgi:hypothetical protein